MVQQDQRGQQDLLVQQVLLVSMVQQDPQVLQVLQDQQVLLELKVSREHPDQQALQV